MMPNFVWMEMPWEIPKLCLKRMVNAWQNLPYSNDLEFVFIGYRLYLAMKLTLTSRESAAATRLTLVFVAKSSERGIC